MAVVWCLKPRVAQSRKQLIPNSIAIMVYLYDDRLETLLLLLPMARRFKGSQNTDRKTMQVNNWQKWKRNKVAGVVRDEQAAEDGSIVVSGAKLEQWDKPEGFG